MKAVQIRQFGGRDVLEIVENAPNPSLNSGQILVEVHAASINPVDWKIREGYFKDMISPDKFPLTLGGDFAGVVSEIDSDVTEFKKGDEVFGSAIFLNGGSGSFAELTAANTKNTVLKPPSLSFEQAAALPLVGASAIQALEEHIKLQKGQKILIHGGAGGIGHVAIQLAKSIGTYVATTIGPEDVEFVKSLGTDLVINYKSEKFEDRVKDFDAVFDTVGGETTNRSFQVLKKGGMLVSMAGSPDEKLAQQHDITAIGQMTKTNDTHLKRVADLIENKIVTIAVDKIFKLEEIKEAFQYQEEIHPRGKVVIEIK